MSVRIVMSWCITGKKLFLFKNTKNRWTVRVFWRMRFVNWKK